MRCPLYTRNAAGYNGIWIGIMAPTAPPASDKADLLGCGGVVWSLFERALTFLTVYSLLVEVAR
jgi:hypothetical protein